MNWRGMLETLTITVAALASRWSCSASSFWRSRASRPSTLYDCHLRRRLRHAVSSWMNTLTRAAPLMLTALCTAFPARLGLINIGGEGALVLGGLAAAVVGVSFGHWPGRVPQIGHGCWPAWLWAVCSSVWLASCGTGAASTPPSPACCFTTSSSACSLSGGRPATRPGQHQQTFDAAHPGQRVSSATSVLALGSTFTGAGRSASSRVCWPTC